MVESIGITFRCVVLEFGFLPILFEGCLEALDDLWILSSTHTDVPLEPFDLRRLGQVRRTDVGGVQAARTVEQPRLGVKTCPRDLVGNLHLGTERYKCIQRTAFGRAGIDTRDHPYFSTVPYPCFKLGSEQTQPRMTHKRT